MHMKTLGGFGALRAWLHGVHVTGVALACVAFVALPFGMMSTLVDGMNLPRWARFVAEAGSVAYWVGGCPLGGWSLGDSLFAAWPADARRRC